MKKQNLFILFSTIILMIITFISHNNSTENKPVISKDTLKIVTSFYPLYIGTLNIVSDIDNIELSNLSQSQSGCLHDYQLTTDNMKLLESADIFIVNGHGMESFLNDISHSYPNLKIIYATENLEPVLLKEIEHNHDHESIHDDDHDHEDVVYNPHVWTSFSYYCEEISYISTQLSLFDKDHSLHYQRNSNQYISKIKELQSLYQKELSNMNGKSVILFHNAFEYLCHDLGMNILEVIEVESDSAFNAKSISHTIDSLKTYNSTILFAEKQYNDTLPKSIAQETNSTLYMLDSGVSGALEKDAYINIMLANLNVLKGDVQIE